MESAIPHGEYELMKKDMLDMSDKGFTPKEIAKFLTDKYKDTTGRLITRNMVIGVKWRAGKCDGHRSLEKQTDLDEMSDEELEVKMGEVQEEKTQEIQAERQANQPAVFQSLRQVDDSQ